MKFLKSKFIRGAVVAFAMLPAGQSARAQEVGTPESNKDVARRFIMATPTGDANVLRAVMAPDAHLALRIAGVYSPELKAFQDGIEWNRDQLIKMEQDRAKALKGPLTVKILSMVTDGGDHVAAEVEAKGVRASNNKPYIQHYSYHFQVRNQKVVDAHLYQDTFHEWDVWQNPGIPTVNKRPPPDFASNSTPLDLPKTVTPEQMAAGKESIRRWANALPSLDPATLGAQLAPDFVWMFAMGGEYSPEKRNFPGTVTRLDHDGTVKFQMAFQVGLKEPETFEIYSLMVDGSEACGEFVGLNVGKDGNAYRQHYSIHFKLRDGKMVEGHVYQDTLHQFDHSIKREKYAPVFAPIYPKG